FVNVYSSDPNARMEQLLNQSKDLRKIEEEWERIWFTDQPSHLTPERYHGGIDEAPKCEVTRAERGQFDYSALYPPCGGNYTLDKKLMQSVSIHCPCAPLGLVLDSLRESVGIDIVVKDGGCLHHPVCVSAQQVPVRAVLDIAVRQCGFQLCYEGDVVCVCGHG